MIVPYEGLVPTKPSETNCAGLSDGVSRRQLLQLVTAFALSFVIANPLTAAPNAEADPQRVVFRDAQGKPYTLGHFDGRPVLVNLWASWCTPCLLELPALDRLQRDRPGLTVLAISQDREGLPIVSETYRRARIKTLDVFLDPESALFEAFRAEALPFNVLIGPGGDVLMQRRGRVHWDAQAERDALDKLVGFVEQSS